MKVFEMCVRENVNIDNMQFRFMRDRGTTDAVFIARQLQYIAKIKGLWLSLFYFEKAFDLLRFSSEH